MTPASFSERAEHHRQTVQWAATLAAVLLLVVSWLYGYWSTHSPTEELVANVLPTTVRVVNDGAVFSAYDSNDHLIGYAAAANATGYGGPVYLLVGVDTSAEIVGIQVIEQRETPGFYALLRDRDYFNSFLGQSIDTEYVLGENIDSVSGATLSAQAVASAIQQATQQISRNALATTSPPIRFGAPEVSLIAFLVAGWVFQSLHRPRARTILRWAMLLTSMIVLGFWLNMPLSLANFASLLSGYLPSWQDHLYWYLLIGGSLAFVLFAGKNTYCVAICPFGGVQDCFGKMGNAKPFLPAPAYRYLKWLPRILAVLALSLGLAFRQPGAASYEPFGTLFSFSAGFVPWMLLVFVLFASMIILRPFCHYLCPVGPILDFVRFLRTQAKQRWKRNTALPIQ